MKKEELFRLLNQHGDSAREQLDKAPYLSNLAQYLDGKREAYLVVANQVFDSIDEKLSDVRALISDAEISCKNFIDSGEASRTHSELYTRGKLVALEDAWYLIEAFQTTKG